MKRVILTSIILVIVHIACNEKKKLTLLTGTWRTDSVYTYYNGFEFTRHDLSEEPLHQYTKEGGLVMARDGETRNFSYELFSHDTLKFLKSNNEVIESFVILGINDEHLVLRKDMNPLFGKNNQLRYELRYFSRIANQ